MQLMALETVQPGMRLGRPIQRPDGLLLLAKGIVLNPDHIEHLQRIQIQQIYVSTGYFDDIEVPELVRMEIRGRAQKAVQQAIASVSNSQGVKSSQSAQAIESLLDEILANRHVTIAMIDVRSAESQMMQHAVSVAVLSISIALHIGGFNRMQLRDIGMGALLHDIGKVMVSPDILSKTVPLNPEEIKEAERHTEHGFKILRSSPEVSLLSAHVAFQHHELHDGSGYPRGIRNQEIHIYAAICAVANIYDRLTAGYGKHRTIYPAAALSWIKSKAGISFREDVVRALFRLVAPYPIATLVRLDTGEVAVVKELTKESLDRPVVTVIRDQHGMPSKEMRVIDLSQDTSIQIKGPVS